MRTKGKSDDFSQEAVMNTPLGDDETLNDDWWLMKPGRLIMKRSPGSI